MKCFAVVCMCIVLFAIVDGAGIPGGFSDVSLSNKDVQRAVTFATAHAAANGVDCANAYKAIKAQQQVSDGHFERCSSINQL